MRATNFVKQIFAQVTNPPLDGIREELITDISLTLGSDTNIFDCNSEACKKLKIQNPVISKHDLDKIRNYADGPVTAIGAGMSMPQDAFESPFAPRTSRSKLDHGN